MTRNIGCCLLLIVMAWIPSAYGKDDPDATARYEQALKRIKEGDLNVDFKKLRFDCAGSRYGCQADADYRKSIRELLAGKKFEEALKAANRAIDEAFVDIEMHYLAFIANMELDKKEQAEFHKIMVRGLLDSIQEDRHGRSEEDAFQVINVREEYVFLGFSKMQVRKQSLVQKGGHYFDLMECTNTEDNSEITVYFNVDVPMERLRKSLE